MSQTNAELLLTVRQFRDLLRVTAGNMTLERFCSTIDNDQDEYARDKWRDLRTLGDLLGSFSGHTLELLIASELELQAAAEADLS